MRGARVLGRSISMPVVIIGALTMKMMSSTSITSTSGVTLISLSGPFPPPVLIPMCVYPAKKCRRTMFSMSLEKLSISPVSTLMRRMK